MPTDPTPDPALSRLAAALTPELLVKLYETLELTMGFRNRFGRCDCNGCNRYRDEARQQLLSVVGAWWEAERQAQGETTTESGWAITLNDEDYYDMNGVGVWSMAGSREHCWLFTTREEADAAIKELDLDGYKLVHLTRSVTVVTRAKP